MKWISTKVIELVIASELISFLILIDNINLKDYFIILKRMKCFFIKYLEFIYNIVLKSVHWVVVESIY